MIETFYCFIEVWFSVNVAKIATKIHEQLWPEQEQASFASAEPGNGQAQLHSTHGTAFHWFLIIILKKTEEGSI